MSVEDLLTKRDCLKIRLGSELVEEIENSRSKCMNRGAVIGTTLGIVAGGLLAYSFGPLGDRDPNVGFDIFYGTFLGLHMGLNVGAVSGLLYSRYKARTLSRQFPDKAEYIGEYVKVANALTGIRVRGTLE